jgi:hypothetical protein
MNPFSLAAFAMFAGSYVATWHHHGWVAVICGVVALPFHAAGRGARAG